jgi:hypothetical protein
MRTSVFVFATPIFTILLMYIDSAFQIGMVYGTTIYSNSTSLSDEYYEDTARIAG